MTRALQDVNVLPALLDSDHVDHDRARAWLDDEIGEGWASCAITENGFVRIISQSRYPSPVSPKEAIVAGPERVRRQSPDAGRAHDGRFVTFDHSMSVSPVHGATREHLIVL